MFHALSFSKVGVAHFYDISASSKHARKTTSTQHTQEHPHSLQPVHKHASSTSSAPSYSHVCVGHSHTAGGFEGDTCQTNCPAHLDTSALEQGPAVRGAASAGGAGRCRATVSTLQGRRQAQRPSRVQAGRGEGALPRGHTGDTEGCTGKCGASKEGLVRDGRTREVTF